MNKRGQEGMTLTTLLLIVLGVVVVVVLILFFTGTFDRFTAARDALPGNLEAAAQGCRIAVQAGLATDFCYNFKDIGDNQYVNCRDPRILESLNQTGTLPSCNDELVMEAKKQICEGVTSQLQRSRIFFNGNSTDMCDKYLEIES